MHILTDTKHGFENYLNFLKGVQKDPKAFSTLFPTSKSTALKMSQWLDVQEGDSVYELGCGAGAITETVVENLPDYSYFLGIEKDTELTLELRKRWQQYSFASHDAADLSSLMEPGSFNKAYASLPWTQMGKDNIKKTVKGVSRSLAGGGTFVYFLCLHVLHSPEALYLQKVMGDHGLIIEKWENHWTNMPPIRLFRARKFRTMDSNF